MTSISSSLLSVGILLSSMFVTLGVIFVLLKHRDSTVKLPVDRNQLQRIPAFGLLPLHFKEGRLCFSSWSSFSPTEQIKRQATPNKRQVNQWLTKAIGQTIPNKEPFRPVLVFPDWFVSSHNFQQLNSATVSIICNKELNLNHSANNRSMRLCIKWRRDV